MGLLRRLFGGAEETAAVPRASVPSVAVGITGAHEPWRKLIVDHPVHATDEDSGEVIDIKPTQDDPNHIEGLLIGFRYVDAQGNKSRRVVLCYRCWITHGILYVRGYCSLRHALRTFRVDQMTNVVEVRTKQGIADPENYFSHYADVEGAADYDDDATGFQGRGNQVGDARRLCIDGLRVLAYIAALRGPISDKEKTQEAVYIVARLDDAGFPRDNNLISSMLNFALAIAVPTRDFRNSLKALAGDKRNFSYVAAIINEITGGSVEASNGPLLAALQEIMAVGEERGWIDKAASTLEYESDGSITIPSAATNSGNGVPKFSGKGLMIVVGGVAAVVIAIIYFSTGAPDTVTAPSPGIGAATTVAASNRGTPALMNFQWKNQTGHAIGSFAIDNQGSVDMTNFSLLCQYFDPVSTNQFGLDAVSVAGSAPAHKVTQYSGIDLGHVGARGRDVECAIVDAK